MKHLLSASAALSLLLSSACTPVLKEVRYPGGYPGYLLDKRTFDASGSKELVLLRATIILAMAADMGRTTVSGQDADGFAQLLAGGVQEINYAAADVFGSTTQACLASDPSTPPQDDQGCRGFHENFESNLPQIESRIIKVMLAALPTDKARKFLDDVAKGNVLGAAWKALGTAGSLAGGLHVASARYRSGLEIVAGSLASCPGGGTFKANGGTVVDAAKCLGLSENDLFDNPDEADREDLRVAKISMRAFLMLMRGIAADCVSLDFSGTGEDIEAKQAARAKSCNSIGFAPNPRPFRIDTAKKTVAPIASGSAPFSGATQPPAPMPSPAPTPTSGSAVQ